MDEQNKNRSIFGDFKVGCFAILDSGEFSRKWTIPFLFNYLFILECNENINCD